MANLTGAISAPHSDTSVVDSSQQVPLGTRARDTAGNEYIYLKGVGSTTAGNWVTYNESYATTLLAADAVGPVAIAMAAVDATTKYGWYQIYGYNTIAKGNSGNVAADKQLYYQASGVVDDAESAGNQVHGAVSASADSSGVFTAWIGYPFVNDVDETV